MAKGSLNNSDDLKNVGSSDMYLQHRNQKEQDRVSIDISPPELETINCIVRS